MHKGQPGEYLKQNYLDCVLWEMRFTILDQLVQVLLHVLKHKVENVVLSYDFLQFHHVCVRKLFQGLIDRKDKQTDSNLRLWN